MPTYASSSSSVESDHSSGDFFSFSPFSPPTSGASSPASSVTSIHAADDQWFQLKRSQDQLVQSLLKNKRENETALRAWMVRCNTLESEVLRLSSLAARLEQEKQELVRKEQQQHKATVCDEVQTDTPSSPSPADKPCDCSPDCSSSATPCLWTGSSWEPVPPPSKPVINPALPMSRQQPPPCNSFYLLGHCDVPRCRFCHAYDLTSDQISEMRRGAKHHVCNAIRNGVTCPDGDDCIYGHVCPRGPSCGRERCGFNDEQHRVVPSPRPVLRRR
ncbi:hypothetical protein JCM10207_007432 [Rhodosporidiobolus poonsookiae]